MASVRRLLCVSHRWFQPVPMEPLQGKAEPLSHQWSASGKTYLSKGKNARRCVGGELHREQPSNTEARIGGGGVGAPDARENNGEAGYLPAAYGAPHQNSYFPEGNCTLWRPPCQGRWIFCD